MRRLVRGALGLAIAGLVVAPSPGLAHQGNPNMQSVIRAVQPSTPGLKLQVVNRDDHFELVNTTGRTIVIYGYRGEPYARILPDGTVQANTNSPAYYLNQERLAAVPVPASANAAAAPRWTVVDKTGRFQWHDHRMHYMGTGVPPGVKDRSRRQKVFDYAIPIRIGDRNGRILGTLFWTPEDTGAPAGAVVAFVLIAVLLVAVAVLVRRRRRADDRVAGDAGGEPRPDGPEAW